MKHNHSRTRTLRGTACRRQLRAAPSWAPCCYRCCCTGRRTPPPHGAQHRPRQPRPVAENQSTMHMSTINGNKVVLREGGEEAKEREGERERGREGERERGREGETRERRTQRASPEANPKTTTWRAASVQYDEAWHPTSRKNKIKSRRSREGGKGTVRRNTASQRGDFGGA